MNQSPDPGAAPGGQPKSNGIARWLIVVLIILVLGIIGYWWFTKSNASETSESLSTATPTEVSGSPSPTTAASVPADWKTYNNKTYFYLVKYPSDWTVSADTGTDPSEPKRLSWVEFQTPEYKSSKGASSYAVAVEVLSYTALQDWINAQQNSSLGKNLYAVSDSDVAGGLAAKQLSTSVERGAVRTGVLYGKYVFVIHLIGESKPNSTYNQILTGFDFTNDIR